MLSVRCHAAIQGGRVYRPAVVVLDLPSPLIPSDGETLTLEGLTPAKVAEIDAELHSTVSYNGVAVIGLQLAQLPVSGIRIGSGRDAVSSLARLVSDHFDNRIVTFLPVI
ncbi:MAG: hypothetical protein K2K92_10370 [Duncaniella sp.]|nr:hypothetical protein [Duncaniella sp.]